jgi:hypothetical protein
VRTRLIAGVLSLALLAGACGLGDKQTQADRIIDAGDALMGASSVAARIAVTVHVLPTARQLVVRDAPRIAPGSLSGLNSILRPRTNEASVAGTLIFTDDKLFERIAPKTTKVAGLGDVVAPNNLQAIVEAVTGQALVVRGEPSASSTTSTTAVRTLRRSVQIVREWAAFDFAAIGDHDTTKHAGSFALNPVAVLRLVTGVLTGSIKADGEGGFAANVSRDKAERDLSEDARDVLDKMFTANAITRTVFPATFAFDGSGKLAAFSVTLRQQLSSKDRADLTIRFRFVGSDDAAPITRPPRRGTATVNTLGELATTVSGA